MRRHIPSGRTVEYAMWRACEQFKILPPGCEASWDDCSVDAQAMLLAYSQLREHERLEEYAEITRARIAAQV